ncbi:MAG: cellulase family glycosylhydrolase [Aeromonadales bacterium]|nr:cellulase family glycosylhydrolase [Aeromonadales bacterium]MDY2891187.1 cellulase family glycosylhydrolase [Succinivibrio sp.]
MKSKPTLVCAAIAAAALACACSSTEDTSSSSTASAAKSVVPPAGQVTSFVMQKGKDLLLDGAPFKIAGTNNYYMHYGTNEMIDSVLDDAAAMGLNTIRVWGFMEGVSHDHSMQPEPGVYEKAGVNSAWERLDYTVAGAKKRGIRVVVVLTNYWPDFGGMAQYAKWFQKPHQEAFYTDKKIIECYKKYIEHMVNHKNKYTGIVNKDEPAIMTWELANEPRCESDKTGNTIVNWAKDISSYIRKLAPKQLIAVGSEGFFNRKGSDDWAYNGYSGVDWERLIELPDVNYGTFHLYPSTWVKPEEEKWGTQWIIDHAKAANAAGKPAVLEEYGIGANDPENRDFIYRRWNDVAFKNGIDGSMFWILTSQEAGKPGNLYPDYDGFRVLHDGKATDAILTNASLMFRGLPYKDSSELYIASPKEGATVGSDSVKISTFPYPANGDSVSKVSVRLLTTNKTIELKDADGDGYWEADASAADLGYGKVSAVASATFAKAGEVKAKFSFTHDKKIKGYEAAAKYDFSNGMDGWESEGNWQAKWGSPALEVSNDLGEPALKLNGSFSGANDWEKIKFRNMGVKKFSNIQKMDYTLYIPANVSEGGIRPYAALGDGWVKLGVDKFHKQLKDLEKVSLNGKDYWKAKIEIDVGDAAKGKKPDFFICFVADHMKYDGPIYVDDIEFLRPVYE